MNVKYKTIIILITCLCCFLSCKTTREEYSSDKFIAVKVLAGDTYKDLAKKYLNDPDKDWIISEFNKSVSLTPGASIVIPLTAFNRGGLKSNGYQIVPVLNYKGFADDSDTDKQRVTATEFQKQLSLLKDNGFRVISADELLEFMDYQRQIPEKSVVITASCDINAFYTIAAPLLKHHDYQATLFIDPLKIDKKMTWERLVELSENGVDIQCATEIPGAVKGKNNGSFKAFFLMTEEKVLKSKKKIEEKLKKQCTFFATTVDKNNSILSNLLMKSGYKAAFIENNGGNPFFADKLGINMSVIKEGLTPEAFLETTKTFHKTDLN